jgi:hypothetical protein
MDNKVDLVLTNDNGLEVSIDNIDLRLLVKKAIELL